MSVLVRAASDAKPLVMSAGQTMNWPRPPFRSMLGKKERPRSTQLPIRAGVVGRYDIGVGGDVGMIG